MTSFYHFLLQFFTIVDYFFLYHFRLFLTVFDSCWQLLTVFDSFWPLLTGFDWFWLFLTVFNHLWSLLTVLDHFRPFRFFTVLTIFSHFFWTMLTVFNRFWPILNVYDFFFIYYLWQFFLFTVFDKVWLIYPFFKSSLDIF